MASLGLYAIAFLGMLTSVDAWWSEGTLPMDREFSVYVGKFCFDFMADRNASKREVGFYNVTFEGQIQAGPALSADGGTGEGRLWMMVFSDQKDHWMRVRPYWDELTCKERLELANWANPLPLTSETTGNFSVNVLQAVRPRFWYFSFVNCGANITRPITYAVHAVNLLSDFEAEFSLDVSGSVYLEAAFTILFALTVMAAGCCGRGGRKEASRGGSLLRLLCASATCSAVGSLLRATHHLIFAVNGHGAVSFAVLGAFSSYVAKALLTILQFIVAKGWAVLYRPDDWPKRFMFLFGISSVVFLSIGCEIWEQYFHDQSTAYYHYESWPGRLILLLNMCLLATSNVIMAQTYSAERHREVRIFYILVTVACGVYMIALPVVCLLAELLDPWVRRSKCSTLRWPAMVLQAAAQGHNIFGDPTQVFTGQSIQVPGFFVPSDQGLSALAPLSATAVKLETPLDQGIQPGNGDDTTAPNATTVARLNRVVCVASANVGYSSAAKDTCLTPSAVEYDAEVLEGPNGFGMTLRLQLMYRSSFPQEGMVVWLKKRQQMINDDSTSELLLVETAFEDYVGGRWVPITTDVRYAQEAEAVVQAVITSDSGQTAGRVQTSGAVEDAKLGPVGEQGRIVLTYFCEQLYSYAQMALPGEEKAGPRQLVPLLFQLPWAPCDCPAAQCQLSVRVRGPSGTCVLDPAKNVLAYLDLQKSFVAGGLETAVVLAAPTPNATWDFQKETLPPMSTAVLAWLSVPDSTDDGWEDVSSGLPAVPGPRATLLKPAAEEEQFLKVALPGGQVGQLVRCRLETAPPKRSAQVMRVHTDITISDASGSTGMNLGGGFGRGQINVRGGFNKVEVRRVLTRLQAFPVMKAQGFLLAGDIWRQQFVIFDHGVRSEFDLETRVEDLDDATVLQLLKALSMGNATHQAEGAAELNKMGKGGLLQSWRGLLEKLHALTPGGATSFEAGANRALQNYSQKSTAVAPSKTMVKTSYVNFDTDGGNNCGPCYSAISKLVDQADVVQGHVLGVGAWVDQDCASKVAKLMKGSTSLSLSFPDDAAGDALLRQDLSRWIRAIRSCPLVVTASAGTESWVARHGTRAENAVDCLAATAGCGGLRFEAPDVSDLTHTKAKLAGLQAGESALLYLLSRVPLPLLQQRLTLEIPGVEGQTAVTIAPEPLKGVVLGHHWLSLLAGSMAGLAKNRACLSGGLRQRLEDDLSFSWNLPTKSGSTAALGRAQTQHRPPVAEEKQPDPPTPPDWSNSLFGRPQVQQAQPQTQQGLFPPARGQFGTFSGGQAGPSPMPVPFGGPPASGSIFGACGGQPMLPTPGAASPTPTAATPPRAHAMMAPMGGPGAAAPAPAASTPPLAHPMMAPMGGPGAAAPPTLAQMQASPANPFGGGPTGCAPPPAPSQPNSGGGLFGQNTGGGLFGQNTGGGGLFAINHTNAAGFGGFGKGPFNRAEEEPKGPEARTPKQLLEDCVQMRVGPAESPPLDVKRVMTALKYLVSSKLQGGQPVQAVPSEKEDPLVAQLLGNAPAATTNQPSGYVHSGFVCDGCKMNPIVGTRFKSCTKVDFDLCQTCRINGNVQSGLFSSSGFGFRPVADTATALRETLLALLEWWPLVCARAGSVAPALPLPPDSSLKRAVDVRGLTLQDLMQLVHLVEAVPGA